MDKIHLRDVPLTARIGASPGEKDRPQRLILNAWLELDLQPAGKADDLRQTVDYGRLYLRLLELVAESRFDLLEALAEAVAGEILRDQRVKRTGVEIEKCAAMAAGNEFRAAVAIERGCDDVEGMA